MARVTTAKPNYKKMPAGVVGADGFMERPVRTNVITDPLVRELITLRLTGYDSMMRFPQLRKRSSKR